MEVNMKAACCWSGGKDSAFAYWKAKSDGIEIAKIINFVTEGAGRCCFHGIPTGLIVDQAKAMNVQLMQVEMPESMEGYEERFRQMLRDLKSEGIHSMVFGDIYLDEHKEWIERVCGLEEIAPILPLWSCDPEKLICKMESSGFEAVVVSCLERLGQDFVGRIITRRILDYFEKEKICPCGEHGEYHTIVTDAPMFCEKIVLGETSKMLVEGFWKHWHLDIRCWSLEAK
jgi:uncharacterized protein (TIGR00290 family)